MKTKKKVIKEESSENESETVTDLESIEGKRKATELDKERKREKNRLKRQRKKDKKLNLKSSDDSQLKTRNLAIDYLKLWKNDREEWKFRKNIQSWLLNNKNLYCEKQIPDEDFSILMEYFVGLKGEGRSRLVKEAESIIENSDEANEGDKVKSKRAKELIQTLE